MQQQTKKKNKN